MVDNMVMGGRIALLGIPPGKSPVDWSTFVFKAITLKGVYGREIFETWYKMLAMLENGLNVRGVITHRFPADEYAEASRRCFRAKAARLCLIGANERQNPVLATRQFPRILQPTRRARRSFGSGRSLAQHL